MDEANKEPAATTEEAVTTEPEQQQEPDLLTQKDAQITQLKKEIEDWKKLGLKRLGKLPGDAEFLEGADKETGLTVAEQVKQTLLEREITIAEEARNAEMRRIQKENSELKLALKNRPGGSVGSDQGASAEVKDNVFSEAQTAELTRRAKRLNVDPATFIENAKKNLGRR